MNVIKYKAYSYACWGEGNASCCVFLKDIATTYKFIDTRIKHTDPTSGTLNQLSVASWARPVDETNYISFLGVWGDTVSWLSWYFFCGCIL